MLFGCNDTRVRSCWIPDWMGEMLNGSGSGKLKFGLQVKGIGLKTPGSYNDLNSNIRLWTIVSRLGFMLK